MEDEFYVLREEKAKIARKSTAEYFRGDIETLDFFINSSTL